MIPNDYDLDVSWTGGDVSFAATKVAIDVAVATGIPLEEIRGRSRHVPIVTARHQVWIRLRDEGWSYPMIASAFGVDHSTVQYACKRGRTKCSGQERTLPTA